MVPQLVSSLDSSWNSTGELGVTSGAGRYQFFLKEQSAEAVLTDERDLSVRTALLTC